MPSSNRVQSYANHARLDPPYHFFLAPVALISLGWTIVRAVRNFTAWSAWGVVMALAGVVAVLLIRTYALKVQDRVIRLEERLRLQDAARNLDEKQLIALRFASDEEAVALARRAAADRLGPKQIKQAIQSWRADFHRV